MNAHLAMPEGHGPFPALIVLQEAFGVNHYIKDVAGRLAKEGYVAIAPELFHRTAPVGYEISYTDFSLAASHIQAITIEGLQNDIQAAFDWLQLQHKVQKNNIGSIGFCLGGRASFIANSFLPLKAAVSFYGGGIHTLLDRTEKLQAPHLFFWGGKDKHILPEHIATTTGALRKAEKDFINVEISYADHGFFCDERAAYQPDAAREAWGMTTAFLKNKLYTYQ